MNRPIGASLLVAMVVLVGSSLAGCSGGNGSACDGDDAAVGTSINPAICFGVGVDACLLGHSLDACVDLWGNPEDVNLSLKLFDSRDIGVGLTNDGHVGWISINSTSSLVPFQIDLQGMGPDEFIRMYGAPSTEIDPTLAPNTMLQYNGGKVLWAPPDSVYPEGRVTVLVEAGSSSG